VTISSYLLHLVDVPAIGPKYREDPECAGSGGSRTYTRVDLQTYENELVRFTVVDSYDLNSSKYF